MIYIFDLDGTLADNAHRLHLIDGSGPKDWARYSALCSEDKPISAGMGVFSALRTEDTVLVWSGRDESTREATIAWFWKYGIGVLSSHLRLRPSGDYTPGHLLKRQWLRSLPLATRAAITCAFEDDLLCATMYRDEGVPCFIS